MNKPFKNIRVFTIFVILLKLLIIPYAEAGKHHYGKPTKNHRKNSTFEVKQANESARKNAQWQAKHATKFDPQPVRGNFRIGPSSTVFLLLLLTANIIPAAPVPGFASPSFNHTPIHELSIYATNTTAPSYVPTIELAQTFCASMNPTSHTSCPFINTMIRDQRIPCERVSADELVGAAVYHYGIDEGLMSILAQGSTDPDSSNIQLSKFLNSEQFPNHAGALARAEQDLALVDTERLNEFLNNPAFSSNNRVSYEQLQKYQEYCWSLSEMSLKDKIPALAEIDLLWGLLGAYKSQEPGEAETLPLGLVYDFLRNNRLHQDFKTNSEDPATTFGLIRSLIYQAVMSGFGLLSYIA